MFLSRANHSIQLVTMANYLIAPEVMLVFVTIIVVKGQSTAQVCENGDSSNSIAAELSHEAIQQMNIQLQSIREILTESNQERKSQQDTLLASLQAVERCSQDQIQSTKVFLNDSVQQMQIQLNTAVTSHQTGDRRLQHQIESIQQFLDESLMEIRNQQDILITSFQVQSQPIHAFINASFRQMITHHDIIIARLEAVDRRSQEQDIHTRRLQSSNEFLNVSFQQMKNQLNTSVTRLQADGRRSRDKIETIYSLLNASFKDIKNQQDTVLSKLEDLDHDHSVIKNQTQKKLEIALVSDVGEVPVLPSVVNNWVVLMQRFDGSLNFSRSWNEYKNGFGDMRRGEFWLGNEKIHRLTNRFACTLRIEMYINGTWYYAEYTTFSIDSEGNNYTLCLSGYSGNAGDSLTSTSMPGGDFLGGMSFSTWDVDNDRSSQRNCALNYQAGWWFNNCYQACLTCSYNGHFLWYWLRHLESSGQGILRAARMMIKSK